MAKTGPKGPRTQINWEDFEKLCSLHCTLTEIAEWFGCSEDTVQRMVKRHYKDNFAAIYKRKSGKGKISLRRKMFETALKGNVTMMIWLSKQTLGYADRIEEKQEVKSEITEVTYTAQWGGTQEPSSPNNEPET